MYTLSNKYVLRGWARLPFSIVNIQTGNAIFVSREDFDVLSKCNGYTPLSNIEIGQLQYYIKNNIVQPSNKRISEEQNYKKYPNRYIKQAHWAITNRCNYKCKHCFISAPHYKENEISYIDCQTIIDSLADCGILKLSLTGGEPFIREDFLDILKYAKEKGVIVTDIYTNGSFISNNILNRIYSIGYIPTFHVSYDGLSTHDWMRGISNVKFQTEAAVKCLKTNGFKVVTSCSLFRNNVRTMVDYINYMSMLGVDEVGFGIINTIGEWKTKYEQFGIEIQDLLKRIVEYLPNIIHLQSNAIIDIAGFIRLSPKNSSYSIPMEKKYIDSDILPYWIGCETMRNTLYINPKGKLLGCEMLTDSHITNEFPNILEKPLKDILNDGSTYMSFIDQRLQRLNESHAQCPNCLYYNVCHGGCRGNANCHKDFWSEDPVACEFFRGGFYEKILDKMRGLNIPKSEV